jgi:uncharacterized protein
MKDLVEYIAKSLVDDPAAVNVEERRGRSSSTLVLHVAPDDAGRVIGKAGRVANAIRTLIRSVAMQNNERISLEIE